MSFLLLLFKNMSLSRPVSVARSAEGPTPASDSGAKKADLARQAAVSLVQGKFATPKDARRAFNLDESFSANISYWLKVWRLCGHDKVLKEAAAAAAVFSETPAAPMPSTGTSAPTDSADSPLAALAPDDNAYAKAYVWAGTSQAPPTLETTWKKRGSC